MYQLWSSRSWYHLDEVILHASSMDNNFENVYSEPFPIAQQHWKRHLWNAKAALQVSHLCKNIEWLKILKIGCYCCGQYHFYFSQNPLGWKRCLEISQSNLPAQAGSVTAGCPELCPAGFQLWSTDGDSITPTFDHPHSFSFQKLLPSLINHRTIKK